MKLHTFTDNGGSIARGTVEVGGYHPDPTTYDAQTATVTLNGLLVNKSGLFNITTDTITDLVSLALDIPVGAKFIVAVTGGCDVGTLSGGTVNGSAGPSLLVPIADGSHAEVLCVAANTFLVEQVTAAGVRTAPAAN